MIGSGGSLSDARLGGAVDGELEVVDQPRPADPRRDLWLHRTYVAPEEVLEPWLTDSSALNLGASYEFDGAVSARLGGVWAKDGGPFGERAIEPFASFDFAAELYRSRQP